MQISTIIAPEELESLIIEAIKEQLKPFLAIVEALNERLISKEEAITTINVSRRTFEYWESIGKIKRINETGQPRYRYTEVIKLRKYQPTYEQH